MIQSSMYEYIQRKHCSVHNGVQFGTFDVTEMQQFHVLFRVYIYEITTRFNVDLKLFTNLVSYTLLFYRIQRKY